MARSVEEHVRQLATVLAGPPEDLLLRQCRFVNNFLRPRGRDVPATHIAADALERLHEQPRVGYPTIRPVFGQIGLRQLQRIERDPRWRHLILDERETDREARELDKTRIRELELTRKRFAKALALAKKRAEKVR